TPVGGGKIGSCQGGVPNRAAGELEPLRDKVEVEVRVERCVRRQDDAPEPSPELGVRDREVDAVMKAAGEGVVEVVREVRREDGHALVRLEALEEVGDLHVRVAVPRVVHFRPLAEERVGLVEEEHRAGTRRASPPSPWRATARAADRSSAAERGPDGAAAASRAAAASIRSRAIGCEPATTSTASSAASTPAAASAPRQRARRSAS